MCSWFIYGKRTAPEHWDSVRHRMIPQDKQFRALNIKGERVPRLENAAPFATKEDAQEFLDKILSTRGLQEGVEIEIRYRAE